MSEKPEMELFAEHYNLFYEEKRNKRPYTKQKLNEIAEQIYTAKTTSKKTRRDYYLLSMYDVVCVNEQKSVIKKVRSRGDSLIYMIPEEEIYNKLRKIHVTCGHGSRDKMISIIRQNCFIPRPCVELFLKSCKACHSKKNKTEVSYADDGDGSVDNYDRLDEVTSLQTKALTDPINEDQPNTSINGEGPPRLWGKRKLTDIPITSVSKRKCQKLVTISPGNDISTSVLEKLDEISKGANVKTEDRFDHFGKYIASILRTLPESRSNYLQTQIVTLILMPCQTDSSRPSTRNSHSSITDLIKTEDSIFSPQDSQGDWINDFSSAI